MKEVINFAWKAIEEEYKRFNEKDNSIKFHADKYDEFASLFEKQYSEIMNKYMNEQTNELDAHKQAAIITISSLQADIVTHEVQKGKISIAPQLIAINVGLSYMNDRLNELLEKKHIKKRIEKYVLPIAIACETPYIEIMSRILYYEQNEQNMSFNILELSDRYFLLEYINLLQQEIEPYLLK